MSRKPSRESLEAKRLYLDSGGTMPLVEIAELIGKSDGQIRKWKSTYKWEEELNGNVTDSNGNVTNSNSNVTNGTNGNVTDQSPDTPTPTSRSPASKSRSAVGSDSAKQTNKSGRGAPAKNQNAKGHGAPQGNQNAVGHGAPVGNANAVTHGFFRKHFPDDEAMHELLSDIDQMSWADMLWISIKTKFAAIIKGQSVMYVRDQEDVTRVLKKRKVQLVENPSGEIEEMPVEQEWEFQMPWDKYATYLNAQSRSMSELRSLIKQFLELTGEDDVRRLQVAKMQQDMEASKERIRIDQERLEIEKAKASGKFDPLAAINKELRDASKESVGSSWGSRHAQSRQTSDGDLEV